MTADVPKHRFYAPKLDGRELALPPGEAHHARSVLRLGSGAAVELFDGRGSAAIGHLQLRGRDDVLVRLDRLLPAQERPRPIIHLAFAVPKGRRLDWLLEKSTELAAASLQPVVFARSVAGRRQKGMPAVQALSAAKRQRWLAHCISAAKQSGQVFLPEIADPLPLAELLATQRCGPAEFAGAQPAAGHSLQGCRTRLLGSTAADAPGLGAAVAPGAAERGILLLVGPEGGLTAHETAAALESGFVPVRLGRTTLRVETAAVALLAAARAVVDA